MTMPTGHEQELMSGEGAGLIGISLVEVIPRGGVIPVEEVALRGGVIPVVADTGEASLGSAVGHVDVRVICPRANCTRGQRL